MPALRLFSEKKQETYSLTQWAFCTLELTTFLFWDRIPTEWTVCLLYFCEVKERKRLP